jgi:hypothetical protein
MHDQELPIVINDSAGFNQEPFASDRKRDRLLKELRLLSANPLFDLNLL